MENIFNKLKGHPHVKVETTYAILFAVGFCHLLNDMIQSAIPAMYPILKDNLGLTFAQIGVITLVFQLTSSIFQPFVGRYADKHPQPYSLSAGMCFTLVGLLCLAFASHFFTILFAVAIIGCGSSVFHPEASRVAQMASGGRKSLAQSIFQVGGEWRQCHRSAVGCVDHPSLWPTCRGMVCGSGIACLCHLGEGGKLVQPDARQRGSVEACAADGGLQFVGKPHTLGVGYTGNHDILEIFL